ncbi:MAG: DUF2065 domain-containing protein [Spongiibacteraceae bacterium]|nr:DUF2065 domain-containing protein [Spongiibacteraceae bacterium]
MWHDVIVALSLLLVAEGILPFLSPDAWRAMAYKVAQMDNRAMRIMGLVSMLVGVTLLSLIN